MDRNALATFAGICMTSLEIACHFIVEANRLYRIAVLGVEFRMKTGD
jgi:hypothetical protein